MVGLNPNAVGIHARRDQVTSRYSNAAGLRSFNPVALFAEQGHLITTTKHDGLLRRRGSWSRSPCKLARDPNHKTQWRSPALFTSRRPALLAVICLSRFEKEAYIRAAIGRGVHISRDPDKHEAPFKSRWQGLPLPTEAAKHLRVEPPKPHYIPCAGLNAGILRLMDAYCDGHRKRPYLSIPPSHPVQKISNY